MQINYVLSLKSSFSKENYVNNILNIYTRGPITGNNTSDTRAGISQSGR